MKGIDMASSKFNSRRKKRFNADKYGKARTQADRASLLADRKADRLRITEDRQAVIA